MKEDAMFITRSKLWSLCLALCLTAGTAAQAAMPNLYGTGQMVPYANFTTGGNLTAVGLLARDAGTVYWAFFDADGNRRANNSFPIVANQLRGFFWNATTAGGTTLADEPGFLLFELDINGDSKITDADGFDHLGANAFYIVPPNDVAYVPTVDVDYYDLNDPNPTNWTNSPVQTLSLNTGTGDIADIQYLIDGASGGDDTAIVIWTTRQMVSTQNMTLHDGDGTSKPITTPFLADNLNLIDPEADPEVTSGFFGDGYVRWEIPNGGDGGDVQVFLFSMVSSPTFGAIQTLLPNVF
jgi:hypothetical protein